MTIKRSAIIEATLKLANVMRDSDRLDVLLGLLDTHPTVILNALKISPSFPEVKEETKYKVIVNAYLGAGKISLIKVFSENRGAGLGEAKLWTEGMAFHSGSGDLYPSGVIAKNLSYNEAIALRNRIASGLHVGFVFEVVRNDASVPHLPYDWNNLPPNPNT